jgi:hypothetical protein
MDIETVKAVGAIIGLIVGVIRLGERLTKYRRRYRYRAMLHGRRNLAQRLSQPISSRLSLAFLPKQEVAVILACAVLLNFISLALSTRLTSILYLDMTGTAIAALLLGPWYGAIAGLVSNGLVNWVLYPGSHGDFVVFPWAIVNITGGLLWGYFGRSASFASFMSMKNADLGQQVLQLLKFGVLGAMIMAIPGTGVELALGKQGILALDPEVSTGLDRFLAGSLDDVKNALTTIFGERTAASLARWGVCWIQNTIRYIPDKTLSFAIAIISIKSGFPLFERELIHCRRNTSKSSPGWMDPAILCVLLVPYTASLLLSKDYGPYTFYPLWISPIVVAGGGMIIESFRSTPPLDEIRNLNIHGCYERARQLLPSDAAARPGPNFALACLAASLLFVLFLPLLVTNYLRIAFNFMCLIYGFQLMLYLYSIAVSQNLAIRIKEEMPVSVDPTPAEKVAY